MTTITPICALKDNYIWMFGEEPSHAVWVVDPGDAVPVIAKLQKENLTLSGILLTHHHADHSGGIADLLKYAGNIPVYGSDKSSVATVNRPLKDGDIFSCGHLTVKAIAIPGHTLDHVAYYVNQALFSGDTLFSAACGRIFEGTPEQMFASLNKLLQLEDTTKIYCGHEYTFKNLLFALEVEPDNLHIQQKLAIVKPIYENNGCTLPTSLGEEKLINPFLRCDQLGVIQAVNRYCRKQCNSPVEVFANLREWKNNF